MKRLSEVAQEDHGPEITKALGRLRAQLHDGPYNHVRSVARSMPQTGFAALATVTYLHSVERNLNLAYPERQPVELYDCRDCTSMQGWIEHDDGTLSPCKNCRPLQHELWARDHMDCRRSDSCSICRAARLEAGLPLESTAGYRPPPTDDDEQDFM